VAREKRGDRDHSHVDDVCLMEANLQRRRCLRARGGYQPHVRSALQPRHGAWARVPANRDGMGAFEDWATEANRAIVDFASAHLTQIAPDISPLRVSWKWGTRECVATPTADGKTVTVRFQNGIDMRLPLIGLRLAAIEDGKRIADTLLHSS
jgi:hypothetical protein